jgi:hypothetical protein
MNKKIFEEKYPNITYWFTEYDAKITIVYDPESPLTSFVKAVDTGGMAWEGKDEYESVDDALEDLEVNIDAYLKEMY